MNNYIINLWTKLFNWDIYKKALDIFNWIEDKNKNFYWISFWNEFCEHLEVFLDDKMINYLKDLLNKRINIYYFTSIVTNNNKDNVLNNINKLIELKYIKFVINDYWLINKLTWKNVYLWNLLNRNRVIFNKDLLSNLEIPDFLSKYISKETVKSNQLNALSDIINNKYHKKFLFENNIKWIFIDFQDIDNLKPYFKNFDIFFNSHLTYVMSWRNCVTYKIFNQDKQNNNIEFCKRYCYNNDDTSSLYKNKHLVDNNFNFLWNTVFYNHGNLKKVLKNHIDIFILLNQHIL